MKLIFGTMEQGVQRSSGTECSTLGLIRAHPPINPEDIGATLLNFHRVVPQNVKTETYSEALVAVHGDEDLAPIVSSAAQGVAAALREAGHKVDLDEVPHDFTAGHLYFDGPEPVADRPT